MCIFFGRLNGRFAVHSIFIASHRFGSVETGLNEVLTFWLCDERLELWSGEGIHQARLGHNQEENLCTGENR